MTDDFEAFFVDTGGADAYDAALAAAIAPPPTAIDRPGGRETTSPPPVTATATVT